MNDSSIPLCVGLDGTLTPVRIADELLFLAAKQSPATFFRLLAWFNRRTQSTTPPVLENLQLDFANLPLRAELVEWLRRERSNGRRLVLIVDAGGYPAASVASDLNLFDEITTTEYQQGTPAERKRDALVARFGEHGFDYVGIGPDDKKIWDASRQAIVVGDAKLGRGVDRSTTVATASPDSRASLRLWIKAMRLHQWAKNGLIFVPAILAHVITTPSVLFHGLVAFVAFGLCASSVYLLNDLFDLAADRRHPRKRYRPFAAGQLSTRGGFAVAVSLSIVAAIMAVAAGYRFAAVLSGYYVLTWAYSLHLKRVPLLDVMMLAGLYTLRIVAGAAAMRIPLSFWILAFSVFIFFSLGFVKRYAELDDARKLGNFVGHARGYSDTDLPLIMSLGTASGYCAIVVLALYINSADSQALYLHHKPLWLICPLMLFWISRVWILTSRGVMHDDPVIFALRDRVSLIIFAALCVIFLSSI
jgi:4-hydroxybenzoate polyprenyltransferase